jgi:hypothetical protein
MTEKNKIKGIEQLNREAPFSVPDKYFNSLNDRIRERIKESEQRNIPVIRHRLRYVLVSGAAAVLAGIALLSYTLFFHSSPDPLTSDDIAFVLSEEIYDLDEYTLESEIVEEPVISQSASADEYEEEVIQYLLDENIELESIVNEL